MFNVLVARYFMSPYINSLWYFCLKILEAISWAADPLHDLGKHKPRWRILLLNRSGSNWIKTKLNLNTCFLTLISWTWIFNFVNFLLQKIINRLYLDSWCVTCVEHSILNRDLRCNVCHVRQHFPVGTFNQTNCWWLIQEVTSSLRTKPKVVSPAETDRRFSTRILN